MKKIEVTLPTRKWGSLTTAYPPASIQVGEDALTDGSVNVRTSDNGMLRRRDGFLKYNPVELSSTISDQYEAIFSDGTHQLLAVSGGILSASTGDGTFVPVKTDLTPTANVECALYLDRIYCGNGIDNPFVIDRTSSYGDMAALPVTITVVDYTALGSDSVTVGATTKTEGVDWTAATSNTATATSLASALDAISGVTATAEGAVITVTSNTAHIAYGSDLTNLTIAGNTALRTKPMGCQPPTTYVTASDKDDLGDVPAGTYTYKVTFVYYGFEESNPGPASVAVSPTGGGSTVALTNVPLGGYGVTARYIYRDDGSGVYRWVGELDNNTATTYDDDQASGDEIVSEDQGLPPVFANICAHADRLWMSGVAGALPYLFHTEAGKPDIVWSTDNILCNPTDPICAPYPYSERVMVLNRRSVGVISGSTSDTFAYQPLPGGNGCVDSRTIQVRSVDGVPPLVWLSDGSVQSFNGATFSDLGESISDLLELNVQQAKNAKGSITHTTSAHFAEGDITGGVSTTLVPGSVTTQNPAYTWDTQAKWEAPSVEAPVNCATAKTPGALKMPVAFAPTIASGTHEGTEENESNNLTLSASGDITGGTITTQQFFPLGLPTGLAYKITITRSCYFTGMHWPSLGSYATFASASTGKIWRDSFGTVGAEAGTLALSATPLGPLFGLYNYAPVEFTGSVFLTPGTYWVGVVHSAGFLRCPCTSVLADMKRLDGSTWSTPASAPTTAYSEDSATWACTTVPAPASGVWYSSVYDSGLYASEDDLITNLATTGTYPAGTSSIAAVYQADSGADLDISVLGDLTPQTSTDLNGNTNLTFPNTKRYWRIKVTLQTADDRAVPVVGPPTLKFPTTTTWISDPIDCSAGVTSYDTLTPTQTVPEGTSVTITAASCATEDGTYSEYAAIGEVEVAQFLKVKAVLTSNAGNTLTPTLSALGLTYTIEGTFVSAAINTGTTPAGWDVFQQDSDVNGGTLTFAMAPTPYSSWVTVTNGQFPAVPVNSLVKWKATFVSTAGKVPVVRSATINWRRSDAQSSRAASFFYDGSYFLAAAPFNSTVNSVILELDSEGNWRRHSGFSAGTFGYFFNEPYMGSDSDGYFYKMFEGDADGDAEISMDLRFKAFDFGDATKRKTLRLIRVTGLSNGATFTPYYSVDGGATWQTMTDELGATSFTVGADSSVFVKRLAPTDGTIPTGSTIMPRLVSSGTPAAEVHEIKMTVFARNSEALNA